MRGLLVFTVEKVGHPFEYDFMGVLRRQEQDHRTMYHMEHMRVLTGVKDHRFDEKNGMSWELDTDPMGEIVDSDSIARQVRQMVSRLYATVHDAHDEKCDMVFVSAGGECTTTALSLAQMVKDELHIYFPRLYTHVMILQDQLTPYGDAGIAHMAERIRACNGTRFYQSIYLLPWEKDVEKYQSTTETIAALVKTMVLSDEDPMIVGDRPWGENWMETAAVVRLEAPVNEITRIIFQYMTDDFIERVLVPTMAGRAVIQSESGKDIEQRVRSMRDHVEEIMREHVLPPLSDLFEVMPRQNPAAMLGEKDEPPRGDAAWRLVEEMYGPQITAQFKERLNHGGDRSKLAEQYRDVEEKVTVSLLQEAFAMTGERVMDLSQVQNYVSALGHKLKEMCDRINIFESTELTFRRPGFLASREAKEAVRIARTRESILQSIYNEVCGRMTGLHREMRARSIERAADNASQYVVNCLAIMAGQFSQRRDIRLSQMPTGNHFGSRLSEVYVQWCKDHAGDLKHVTAAELCACFTPDLLKGDPKEAVAAVIDRLMDMFERFTSEAVDTLRVHISQFFKEIDFRTQQLENIGASDDLVLQLREHMMEDRSGAIPILLDTAGEREMREPVARAFVFHRPSCASSHRFGELVTAEQARSTTIISDPFETGVQMVVKYAGNALNHTLFYLNNA